MSTVGTKIREERTRQPHEELNDVLGLSMLSLSGFQIYHICDKKLFPYFLLSEKRSKKIQDAKEE